MATVSILKTDGSEAGSLDLNDAVFAVDPHPVCVRAVLNQFLANRRSGTHSTKTRSTTRGGGRKPWRQKGTGRARQGSIRAVQWRGGAVAFGPHPRDYSYRVNRKVRRRALCSAWSELMREGRLKVIESFGLDRPKTRRLVELLDGLGTRGTVLILTEQTEEAVALSARNLPWAKSLNVSNLNIYDLLNYDWVVATPGAIKRVEATFG